MSDDNAKRNLICINANFGTLADAITKLGTSGLSPYESIQIIKDIAIKIKSAAVNVIGNSMKNILKSVVIVLDLKRCYGYYNAIICRRSFEQLFYR